MLVETTNDAPGYEVLGQVFGPRVRSRNALSQTGAWLKSLVGGELKGMTENLEASRQEVIDRLAEAAGARGANAVLAMRPDTSEIGGVWTEICAYGGATKVRKTG
ncbi:MAG: YbjQ family protein [Acidimicrobiales bacterium]